MHFKFLALPPALVCKTIFAEPAIMKDVREYGAIRLKSDNKLKFHFCEQLIRCFARRSYTQDQNVLHGWPVYEVKCLCSKGIEGGRVVNPKSFAIFDSCDMKS